MTESKPGVNRNKPPKSEKKVKGITQTLRLSPRLTERAINYDEATGVKLTEQLRNGLDEFLTKRNY